MAYAGRRQVRGDGGDLGSGLAPPGPEQPQEKATGAGHPQLSDRRNILVIVDEAHRSHYDSLDGYARHLRDALPYATLIAFTGTPIPKAEADTRAVFGEYIDIYDLKRAVDDDATVRVYHEPRVIDVSLPPGSDPDALDEQADALTEGMDDAERRRALQYAATMNTVYGAPDRIATLADDLIAQLGAASQADEAADRRPRRGHDRVRYPRDLCPPLRRARRAA
ncbi:DEAD/DEAH box helicase family protein [Streptomyces glaucescens]|uniref:DEAD/DEAH box helicase family protein n=1 Tax=Streptomyces glaucescens TaxID=1907 RepID=UPI001AD8310E|nr:DEAD/DEAH box helicase family protein [Streptomyces glaucescens]